MRHALGLPRIMCNPQHSETRPYPCTDQRLDVYLRFICHRQSRHTLPLDQRSKRLWHRRLVSGNMQVFETVKARSLEHRHPLLGQKQAYECLGGCWACRCNGYRHSIGRGGAAECLPMRICVARGLVPILHRRVTLIDLFGKIEKREALDQRICDVGQESVDASVPGIPGPVRAIVLLASFAKGPTRSTQSSRFMRPPQQFSPRRPTGRRGKRERLPERPGLRQPALSARVPYGRFFL